ncbi:MAG: 16S rRNA (cytidine(1402)-2'-O)-methyltransferase [Alphaproteobacteria bacterium]
MARRDGAKNEARAKSQGGARTRSVNHDGAAPQRSDSAARSKRRRLAAGLYLVATPIGNAADITLHALEVLAAADVVACEDTRVTGKLLAIHGVRASLTPYHEHNARHARPQLIARIARGEAVALAADAGTPLISDPGYKLVAEAVARGLAVTTVPGASAPLAALTVSGLPTDRFLFAGFLPPRKAARQKALAEIAAVRATLVVFESPRRLAAALADMADVLGARPAAVARELTKRFEEVRRGSLADLARHYGDAGAPKGEIVVVVGPPEAAETDAEDVDARLRAALATQSVRDAATAVAAATGLSRRKLYARALALAGGR